MSTGLLSDSNHRGLPASRWSVAQMHAVSNRLWYEYRVMRCTARATPLDSIAETAFEISFALYLRNLYVFLFSEQETAEGFSAEDFIGLRWRDLRPSPSPLLTTAIRWAETRLASVASRSNQTESEPRGWTLVQASLELQRFMDSFISNTPRSLLGSRWKVTYANGLTV